ncbi:MAG: PAS domain-containing protein [Pseudomonadota bacterium]
MAHPVIASVTRYWDTLRDARLVPLREEIDPRAIQPALSYAFILARPRPGTVRFRLSGTHLNDVMGMEARGMPVRAICDVPHRRRFMEHVERVFETPSALEVDLRADRGRGHILRGKMSLLPLRSSAGEIDRALGIVVTEGAVLQPPVRFVPRGFAVTPLRAGRPLDEGRRDLYPAGLHEDASVFHPAPATPARAEGGPILRVLDGGKP